MPKNALLTTASAEGTPTVWFSLMLPLLLLAAAMTGVGIYTFESAKKVVTQDIAADMEAIAKLKVDRIEQWLGERNNDARLISSSQLSADLQQWLDGGRRDNRLKNRLLAHLHFQGLAHYRNISLLSAVDGSQLLKLGDHPDLPAIRAQALESAGQGAPILEDIHAREGANTAEMEIGFFSPVRAAGGGQVLAVMHTMLDPDDVLYPLLKKWPGASKSAETLLLRREGDEILFLNTVRHISDSALRLRRPLAEANFIATRLIREGEGFFEANDYRGAPSFAYGMPVAGTPWYLVAKVDRDEAYARFFRVARISAVLFCALLLVCIVWLVSRKRLEMALSKSYREIEDLYQNAPCGYHSVDKNGAFMRINDTELKLLGYSRDEVVGKMRMHNLHTAASKARFEECYQRFMESGLITDMEFEFMRKDGTVVPVLVNATAIKDDQGRYVMSRSIIIDITERKLAEHIQHRLSRALRLLSECNMALVRAIDEHALLDLICRLTVETGGYPMAWVGIAEHDAQKSVRVASRFGDETGYLDAVRICWEDNELGRGPTGAAIRTGATQVNPSWLNNPAMAPWRAAAIKRGYQSSIALPLAERDVVFGALTLYALEANAFGSDEVKLLEELAGNLAFGITTLRARVAHVQAEHELRLTQERLQGLFGSIKDAVFVLGVGIDGKPGCFTEVNDVACERLGYSRAELLTLNPISINAPEHHADILLAVNQMFESKTGIFERTHLTRDGRRIPVEISASGFTLHGQKMIVSLARDITERKRLEKTTEETLQRLRDLSTHLQTVREEEKARIAREIHDDLGGTLTALKIDLYWLTRNSSVNGETNPLLERIESMSHLLDNAVGVTRRIITELRPSILDDLGLLAAIEWQAAQFHKRTAIKCRVNCVEDKNTLDRQSSITLFRILQEALTNVMRHSGASLVDIEFRNDDNTAMLQVHDNGCGLSGENRAAVHRYGIRGMLERANSLGGRIDIESPPEGGLKITATLPLHNNEITGENR